MRDTLIFDALTLLLDELTSTKAQTIRVSPKFCEQQIKYLLMCNLCSVSSQFIKSILLFSMLDVLYDALFQQYRQEYVIGNALVFIMTKIIDPLMCILDICKFTTYQISDSFSHFFFFLVFQEKFLKTIGSKHHLFEFLRILTTKCSPSIFSSEHVQYLLNQLCGSISVNAQLKAPSIKLLLVRIYVGEHAGIL